MKKFETYQDYKNFIYEEWDKGNINELQEDGLTVPETTPGSPTINNRLLTEDQFNQKYGK